MIIYFGKKQLGFRNMQEKLVKKTRKKVNIPFFPLGLSKVDNADIVFLVRQQ